jgi:hypothetical protein
MLRMKVPCGDGLASHAGPEPCVAAREGVGEALTGEDAGRVMSSEIPFVRDADAVVTCGWPDRPAFSRLGRAGPRSLQTLKFPNKAGGAPTAAEEVKGSGPADGSSPPHRPAAPATGSLVGNRWDFAVRPPTGPTLPCGRWSNGKN